MKNLKKEKNMNKIIDLHKKYNLTLMEASKLFNVSYAKLYRYMREEKLEGAIVGGVRRTNEESMVRFLNRDSKIIMPKD
jgi:predicted site-specific integrase-resolvase